MKKKIISAAVGVLLLSGALSGCKETEKTGTDALLSLEEAEGALEEQGSKDEAEAAAGLQFSVEELGQEVSYIDFEAGGNAAQFLALKDADGTVKLALNTCQVCGGSPYAYFEPYEDGVVCQNCGNYFPAEVIGMQSSGCIPVPVAESSYVIDDGVVTVSESFLNSLAGRFVNWKKF